MKIFGDRDEANVITLTHKGKNIKFRCYPKPSSYMQRTDLEVRREAEIVFDDLEEINEMISMLERFREECRGYIGEWR